MQAVIRVIQKEQKYAKISIGRAKGVSIEKILEYLVNSKTGKFLLVVGQHCIAIDADRGLILESHPNYPPVSKLSLESFTKLDIFTKDLQKLYRLTQQ